MSARITTRMTIVPSSQMLHDLGEILNIGTEAILGHWVCHLGSLGIVNH